jgi:hypothetical protein
MHAGVMVVVTTGRESDDEAVGVFHLVLHW